jgi:hypothetical protein
MCSVTLKERVDELAPERRKIIFDPVVGWTGSTRPATH